MRTIRMRGALSILVTAGMLLALLAPGAAAVSSRAAPVTVRGATWYVRPRTSAGPADAVFRYGRLGDAQVMGDWNRNGVSTPGVFRNGRWLLRNWLSGGKANRDFRFGRRGDVPVVGDWNGDGRATVGVVRGNRWLLRTANSAGPADRDFRFGRRGDVPVVGDWNRDGRMTVGVVRGAQWRLRNANSGGEPNRVFSYGTCGDVFLSTQSARTTPGVPPSLVGTEWTTLPTSEKVVALTFDAGANADGVPSILSTLDAKGVPGTFFLTGRWLQNYSAHGRAIAARYPVGNHSDTHPDLTTLPNAEVRAEIADADVIIRRKTGAEPRPWFRFPFGARDARTLGVANCLAYGSVRWTVDTLGWQGTSGGQSVDTVIQRVLNGLRPGAIVLMHVGSHPTDGSTLDADALPRIINKLHRRGYQFVTLDPYG